MVASSPAPTERRRFRGEHGESLIEILATITVMGIAVVSVLFALGAGIAFSSTHRDQANAGVAVGAAAEAVKVATPVACASLTNSSYTSALSNATLPTGWTAAANLSITGVTCSGPPLQLQTITIKATAAGDAATESVSIVKRSP